MFNLAGGCLSEGVEMLSREKLAFGHSNTLVKILGAFSLLIKNELCFHTGLYFKADWGSYSLTWP